MARYSNDIYEAIRHRRVNNEGWESIAANNALNPDGISADALRLRYARWGQKRKATIEAGTVGVEVSGQLVSLEHLYDEFGIDEEQWDVQRVVVNGWGENRQAKAWLKPRTLERDLELIKEQLEAMQKASPRRKRIRHPRIKDGHLLELALFDQHFGMLAWGPEVRGAPYDIKIARRLYMAAFERLAATAQVFPIERILLPIGNDLMHVDMLAPSPVGGKSRGIGTTTAGTPQDVDTRYKKMFTIVRETIVEAIEHAKQIAPVDVVIIPGNHDAQRSFYLGDSLYSWFRNDPNVTIDNGPSSRKYYDYGTVLLGFTHGKEHESPRKKESLPMVMAVEQSEKWAASTWREWHLGHQHAKRDVSFEALEEFGKVRVRVIPSLVTEDEWHFQNCYKHQRAAEAYIWHPTAGFTGLFSVNVMDDYENELAK